EQLQPAETTSLIIKPIASIKPKIKIERALTAQINSVRLPDMDGAPTTGQETIVLGKRTIGAYQQYAPRLVARGYAPVPIEPGTKKPGFYCAGMWTALYGWQRRYLNGRVPSPRDHELWGNGDTGIGMVGGQASHGAIAIDID